MSLKRTRIVTKIGYLYKTIDTARGPRYLQLVAIDEMQLNSDVIVIFRNPKDATAQLTPDQIATLPVEAYKHSTISAGVRQGLWHKIGKAEIKIPVGQLSFKSYQDSEIGEITERAAARGLMDLPPLPFPHWTVWTPEDSELRYVDEAAGVAQSAMSGSVSPPSDIIYIIEHGHSESRAWWPKGSIEKPAIWSSRKAP